MLQVSCLKLHFSLIKVVISVCFLPSQKDVFRNLSQITVLDHIRATNSKISVFNSVKNVQSFFCFEFSPGHEGQSFLFFLYFQ